MLHSLARDEQTRKDPSDAVIFLGPWSRLNAESSQFEWDEVERQPRFYNIVYYGRWQRGGEFGDGIQRLMKKQDGVTYRIHSPGELAQALQKLNLDLEQRSQEISASR